MTPESHLFIRLYLDEDVHKRVASALRLRRFDVVSAHEVGRWGLSDAEQLAYAATEGRALFTYNTPDYLRLHLDWLQRGQERDGSFSEGNRFTLFEASKIPVRLTGAFYIAKACELA